MGPPRGGSGPGRGGRGATARRPSVPRPATRRLAVLGAILVLLAVMLLPTVRAWLAQRDERGNLVGQVAAQEQTVRDLESQMRLWNDPAYVERQARERLRFVKAGETAYTVVGADQLAEGLAGEGHSAVVDPKQLGSDLPWFTRMEASRAMTDDLAQRNEVPTHPIEPAMVEPTAPGPTSPADSSSPSATPSATDEPRGTAASSDAAASTDTPASRP